MVGTNLPVQLTSFIGRERELAEVAQLLSVSRLVTLIGSGGCGKTRLALQCATGVKETYQDGVWLVDLVGVNEPGGIPQRTAQVLGIRLTPNQAPLDIFQVWLESKQLLLILDNCEHMITACAHFAQQLLISSTGLKIMATSREPLALAGEAIYQVSGLDLPDKYTGLEDNLNDLMQYDAVQLFIERGCSILPGLELTPQNASGIVEICRQLDGFPLAIELASAWSNVLTHQQIAERLQDQFALLISTKRGGTDPRHRTMRATLDWSYDLLSASEQIMLARLSVFAGGFSLVNAEAVCSSEGIERAQVLDLLSLLVDKSLVAVQILQRDESRFYLLETIRQYTWEKLLTSGEMLAIRDRHLQYFQELAEEAGQKLNGPQQQLWLTKLEGEYSNFQAAMTWSLEKDGSESSSIELGLRIANALYQFWTIRDYVEDGMTWLERLLASKDTRISKVVAANALCYVVLLAGFRGNTAAQVAYGREAALFEETLGEEDKPALVWLLATKAYVARTLGDFETEYTINKRTIQMHRELDNRYFLGVALSTTSFTAMSAGAYADAHTMLDEALPILRELGNSYRIAMALNFRGDLERLEGNYAAARGYYEESIFLLRELDAPRDLASVLHNLGHSCLHLGELDRARALFNESIGLQLAQHNMPGVAECLIGFAGMAVTSNLPAAGMRLLATAASLGGERVITMWAATRREYEYYLEIAQDRLTQAEIKAEQAAGAVLSQDLAVEFAHSLPYQMRTAPLLGSTPDELTKREREVAGLIASGKSNEEIADKLVISKRTVESHIANIRSKLGFTQRTQIVRWVIESGMVKNS